MNIELIIIVLLFLIINTLYLALLYKRVRTNISKTVVNEVAASPDEIIIYPEVVSIRTIINEKPLKLDGIIYMSDKKIVFHHLFKKNKGLEIKVSEIKNTRQQEIFMDTTRKGKKACILQLSDNREFGIFVGNSTLWEKKIKRARKKSK